MTDERVRLLGSKEGRLLVEKIKTAQRNGSARKKFVERVGELLEEYEQGRGATACLADIKKAYAKVDKTVKAGPPPLRLRSTSPVQKTNDKL